MKHEGNLRIEIDADAKKYAGLTEVGGDLHIHSSVTLPKLTSVGGDLSIYSSVTFEAPKLTSVGGDLYINSSVTLPKLTSVGGYLYIYSDVKFNAPELYAKGFDNFKVYDGVACVIMSAKKQGDIEILSCRHGSSRPPSYCSSY